MTIKIAASFVERLGETSQITQAAIYAWSLMTKTSPITGEVKPHRPSGSFRLGVISDMMVMKITGW